MKSNSVSLKILFSVIALSSVPAQAGLGGIVKNSSDNSVRIMNWDDANQYCLSLGENTRLPTPRELLQGFYAPDAPVIRETAHPGISVTDPNVHLEIQNMNTDGYTPLLRPMVGSIRNSVEFYYNASLYQRPQSEIGNYSFWSNTPSSHDISSGAPYGIIVIDGYNGKFLSVRNTRHIDSFYGPIAVRCFVP